MKKQNKDSGFTLIELSIVIVIIGLIVAGVLGGQSLVKQANLKKVINDYKNIKTSINSFKLAYNALPGDMSNASDYWPTAINGNNNKKYNGVSENQGFWQHLDYAKIMNFKDNDNNLLFDSPIKNTHYVIWQHSATKGRAFNTLNFNGPGASGWGPSLNVKDALSIDRKIDDGLANKGIVLASEGLGRNDGCTIEGASFSSTLGTYKINEADNDPKCWVFFELGT